MIVVGIDPGPMQSAYCVWDGEKIQELAILSNPIMKQKALAWAMWDDAQIAVEHLQCFGMAVGATVFETAYWIGELRCTVNSKHFVKVLRSEVKMHWCNSMRAKDSNITQALIDRFGAKGTKKAPGLTYGLKGDLWSAFAIAAMVWDKNK